MKKFTNIKAEGKLNSFATEFIFVPEGFDKSSDNGYFISKDNNSPKFMYVELSGALDRAYKEGKITVAEMHHCDVINIDKTGKLPKYILRIPFFLLPNWRVLAAKEIDEVIETISIVSVN